MTTLPEITKRHNAADAERIAGRCAEAMRGYWHFKQALRDLVEDLGHGDDIEYSDWEAAASDINLQHHDADAVTNAEWATVLDRLGF